MIVTAQVTYRAAAPSDVERTYQVFLEANEDLDSRLHRTIDAPDMSPSTRALAVRRSALRYDPERFWVAEAGGCVVGFGLATVRGHLWYLAALHVLPAHQSRGVGRELLQRCLASEPPGASRLTQTDADQPVANALYARFGMFPQTPVLHLEGRAWTDTREHSGLRVTPIAPEEAAAPDLAAIDQSVFGTPRAADHDCWLHMPRMQGLRLQDGGATVGYCYLDGDGIIGPLATTDPRLLGPALEVAVHAAVDRGTEVVRARVPGTARAVIARLLDRGFRVGTPIHLLLTSADIENLDRYLFSGGDALY